MSDDKKIERDMRDLVAAGISIAIDEMLMRRAWLIEDMIDDSMAWIGLGPSFQDVSKEVMAKMAEYSMHLQANFCDDILTEWEASDAVKNRSAYQGQGNSGKSGERLDSNTAEAGVGDATGPSKEEIEGGWERWDD